MPSGLLHFSSTGMGVQGVPNAAALHRWCLHGWTSRDESELPVTEERSGKGR